MFKINRCFISENQVNFLESFVMEESSDKNINITNVELKKIVLKLFPQFVKSKYFNKNNLIGNNITSFVEKEFTKDNLEENKELFSKLVADFLKGLDENVDNLEDLAWFELSKITDEKLLQGIKERLKNETINLSFRRISRSDKFRFVRNCLTNINDLCVILSHDDETFRYDLIELASISHFQVNRLVVSIDTLELVLADTIEFCLPKITNTLYIQFEDYTNENVVKTFCQVFEDKLTKFDSAKFRTSEVVFVSVVHRQNNRDQLFKTIFKAWISRERSLYVKNMTLSVFERAWKSFVAKF